MLNLAQNATVHLQNNTNYCFERDNLQPSNHNIQLHEKSNGFEYDNKFDMLNQDFLIWILILWFWVNIVFQITIINELEYGIFDNNNNSIEM